LLDFDCSSYLVELASAERQKQFILEVSIEFNDRGAEFLKQMDGRQFNFE